MKPSMASRRSSHSQRGTSGMRRRSIGSRPYISASQDDTSIEHQRSKHAHALSSTMTHIQTRARGSTCTVMKGRLFSSLSWSLSLSLSLSLLVSLFFIASVYVYVYIHVYASVSASICISVSGPISGPIFAPRSHIRTRKHKHSILKLHIISSKSRYDLW